MATQFKNDKGFLIVYMTWREYVACTETWGLCDCCGESDFDNGGYYVANVNDWYCPKCFKAYYDSARFNKIDIRTERQNYNNIVGKLRDLGVWEI